MCWKRKKTGEIGCTISDLAFKIIANPLMKNYPSLIKKNEAREDPTIESHDLDDIFSDELVAQDVGKDKDFTEIYYKILNFKKGIKILTEYENSDEILRNLCSCDLEPNFVSTLSIDSTVGPFASIEIKKPLIISGSQLYINIIPLKKIIQSILIKVECIEAYSNKFLSLKSGREQDDFYWIESIKEQFIVPERSADQINTIIAIPPDAQGDYSCDIFNLKWRLTIKFELILTEEIDIEENSKTVKTFDFSIPIKILKSKIQLIK